MQIGAFNVSEYLSTLPVIPPKWWNTVTTQELKRARHVTEAFLDGEGAPTAEQCVEFTRAVMLRTLYDNMPFVTFVGDAKNRTPPYSPLIARIAWAPRGLAISHCLNQVAALLPLQQTDNRKAALYYALDLKLFHSEVDHALQRMTKP